MNHNTILFAIFIGLLFSCKNNSKKNSENENIDKTIPKVENFKNVVDSTKIFNEIGFEKTQIIKVNEKLKKSIVELIESVETVDFTGDKKLDFICKAKIDSTGIGNEYWLSSDFKIVKKLKYYSDGFYYRWFINLDNDPEPEIYEAIGDEDGADYIISDQNLVTGTDKTLIYINPVIIERDIKYWGYPWDIVNIKARTNGEITELYCSLNHKIIRDGNEEINPKNQKQMPVIFFSGHHTQESVQRNIKDEKWMTLKNIIIQTKK